MWAPHWYRFEKKKKLRSSASLFHYRPKSGCCSLVVFNSVIDWESDSGIVKYWGIEKSVAQKGIIFSSIFKRNWWKDSLLHKIWCKWKNLLLLWKILWKWRDFHIQKFKRNQTSFSSNNVEILPTWLSICLLVCMLNPIFDGEFIINKPATDDSLLLSVP